MSEKIKLKSKTTGITDKTITIDVVDGELILKLECDTCLKVLWDYPPMQICPTCDIETHPYDKVEKV